MAETFKEMVRCLSMREVSVCSGLSRSWLYELMKHDPGFPKPLKVGRRTLFYQHEIEDWLRSFRVV
jgi:predicted DNA-binding transcriptional regulator AlpA